MSEKSDTKTILIFLKSRFFNENRKNIDMKCSKINDRK